MHFIFNQPKFFFMKKFLFFSVLIMNSLSNLQAGYVIRGINATNVAYTDLMNYTLTFDGNGNPIAAGSVHSIYGPVYGCNCIIIVRENTQWSTIFPIGMADVPVNDIVVRDFHYLGNDHYILCGSRRVNAYTQAFIAILSNNFTTMQFYEYREADCFYSIWREGPSTGTVIPDFYLCGTKNEKGILGSVSKSTMQPTTFYETDIPWQYHKIVSTGTSTPHLVVSGRNPGCTRIGFSVFDLAFSTIRSYYWSQNTEQASLCVVTDDVLIDNTIIMASSDLSTITLNPITFPLVLPTLVRAYRFNFNQYVVNSFYVQDIGTIQDGAYNRISVVGNVRWGSQNLAWHLYMLGLSGTSTVTNNFFDINANAKYENYKIRHQSGIDYTGGHYQKDDEKCVLFSKPLTIAPNCDYRITNLISEDTHLQWYQFYPSQIHTEHHINTNPTYSYESLPVHIQCPPFKKDEAQESEILPVNENGIITNADYIIVTNIQNNFDYQIYNVVGQLVQSGTTNSDISTAKLNKGVYILRLENGKTFKFVK